MWDLCEEDQSYQQGWSSSIKNTPLDLVLVTKEQLKFKASNYFDDLNPFVYTPYTTLHSVLCFHFTSIQFTYWENLLSQTITRVEISCENSHGLKLASKAISVSGSPRQPFVMGSQEQALTVFRSDSIQIYLTDMFLISQ